VCFYSMAFWDPEMTGSGFFMGSGLSRQSKDGNQKLYIRVDLWFSMRTMY